jgi:hypothetical protein
MVVIEKLIEKDVMNLGEVEKEMTAFTLMMSPLHLCCRFRADKPVDNNNGNNSKA